MTKARAPQSASPDELAESARAVVHDAGDPRIDAHLRALGLAPDADAPAMEAVQSGPAEAPELVALRSRVPELEAALAASERRVQQLGVALGVAIVVAVILVALLASRPG